LQQKGLNGASKRFDHVEKHFQSGEKIENYIEMDGNGVKGKGPEATSSACDGKSVTDIDDWDSDYDPTPILERSSST
jgi:hypothetical protein